MSDIWSNVGGDLGPSGKDWLYRQGASIHGPLPEQAIADKLIKGELSSKVEVAKEGGSFHPISQVAAFQPHLEAASQVVAKRAASRTRMAIVGVLLILGGVGAGVWMYVQNRVAQKSMRQQQLAHQRDAQYAADKAKRDALLQEDVALVALVSFDVKKMKMGKAPVRRRQRRPGGGSSSPPPMVSQCQRDQSQIIGVLSKHLRKINFCVNDEKKRDTQGLLPPELKLSFVAKPDGKVSDFAILDRHYRTGPMRNCLLKTFRMIQYPRAGGANCPVTIPIRIGG